MLSGWLPSSMSKFNFLSFLDLSYNNFSGRIPSSTQLQSLPTSAFVGNPALCGPPLPQTCPTDEKPMDGGVKCNQQYEDEFWRWFKPSMEVGLAFGFLGALALKLNDPWKHICFLLFNYMKVLLKNLKDYLLSIAAALCLVITMN
ncbi:hypothetical protein SLEP1_g39403 [Rubroshorea leprosula]|uniref:Uncharacterized protein n=1 Tax=Rubroshorea leprosula TaxID=152421 RepID=A0AAV5L0T7_9ROSI|nr:hypothetical protein SLEP1_g39403 [Rubroshorea leprosula]